MSRITSTAAPTPQVKQFHAGLLKWYQRHGRHALPWRQTRDPYEIWVSEVMLQQTQVATVRDKYYAPFLKKFPTVQALAAAPRQQVLKAWEGLGYYRRAGFLHEAAKAVVSRQLSVFSKKKLTANDSELTTLLSLPGIGRNTAHAILAFAHQQPLPVMEANVKRIVARIFALKTPKEDELWAGAFALLNNKNPFDHNQAMMDLGSLICTPRNAHCTICPANDLCKGRHAPELYPAQKAKKKIPTRRVAILVREDSTGKFYLEARSDALLGGLYGFPQVPVIASEAKQSILKKVDRHGLRPRDDGRKIGTVTHTYSHFKLEGAVCYQRSTKRENGKGWFSRDEIKALPLSRADHKVLELLGHSKPKKRTKA